jgi:DNA-binding SARP family transcriptional activator
MTRLETLGGLRLLGNDGSPIPAQRRRLALLALLVVAGERGISRDKLQAYLWPEGDPDGARHALEQAIYGLRRQLGDQLFSGTNPLILDPSVLGSDASELVAALDRNDHAAVARIHRGAFLDGFFVGESPEFERWAEACRVRFSDAYLRALEWLAQQEQAAGHPEAALEWRRLLVAADPYSPGPTLALMRALAAVGDTGGALNRARIYETLVRKDFDADPDPAIAALVEEFRRAPGKLAAIPAGSPPESAGSASRSPAASTEGRPAAERPAAPVGPGVSAPPARLAFGRWAALLTIGVLGAIVLGLGRSARFRAEQAPAPNRVVVVPFRIVGPDSSLAYLSEGMVDLLGSRLTGEGGPETADPAATLAAWKRDRSGGPSSNVRLARTLQAGLILEGQIAALHSGRVSLTGTLRAAPEGALRGRAEAQGSVDSLQDVVDRFATRLLAAESGERDDRIPILGSVPLPALRAFLAARESYRRGRFDSAVDAYARALRIDSTFALAGLELAAAAGLRFKLRPVDQAVADRGWWSEADTAWTVGIESAWRERERLSPADRVYLHALRGIRFPQSTPLAEHLRAWEQVLHVTPDRADAWYRMGVLLLYLGPSVEIVDAPGRARRAFERALSLDSTFLGPLLGMVDAAAFVRDTAAATRFGERYLRADATGDDATYVRWRLATLRGDDAARARLREGFEQLSSATLARVQWMSQMDGVALDDAERAVAILLRRAGSPLERTRAVGLARWLALNRGQPATARALEDSVRGIGGERYWNPLFSVLYALFWGADTAEAEAAARAVARDPGLLRPADLFVLGLRMVERGDPGAADRVARAIRTTLAEDPARFAALLPRAEMLEALAATARGRPPPPRVVERLDSIARLGCCEAPHFANLIVARLRERQGDIPGALRAVRRGRWFFPPEYLSAAVLEEGRLAALAGDTAGSLRAYRHFLALTAGDADAGPRVQEVRAALARLER